MTEITRERVEALFKVIQEAKDELATIRNLCPHSTVEHVTFAQERPPNLIRTTMCTVCNKPNVLAPDLDGKIP